MFVIVGQGDVPLYEASLNKKQDAQSLVITQYFSMHSSLDVIDEKLQITNQKELDMFFKKIDRCYDQDIYAFVTATNIKLLLLISEKTKEENVNNFFLEAYENLNKQLMNPLYKLNTQITSQRFDEAIRQSAKKHLNL
ncbi:hypothetical protein ABPG74_017228 [Tetrahymena malaccensis]